MLAYCVGVDLVWATPPSTVVEIEINHFVNGGIVFVEIIYNDIFEVEISFFHFFNEGFELFWGEF